MKCSKTNHWISDKWEDMWNSPTANTCIMHIHIMPVLVCLNGNNRTILVTNRWQRRNNTCYNIGCVYARMHYIATRKKEKEKKRVPVLIHSNFIPRCHFIEPFDYYYIDQSLYQCLLCRRLLLTFIHWTALHSTHPVDKYILRIIPACRYMHMHAIHRAIHIFDYDCVRSTSQFGWTKFQWLWKTVRESVVNGRRRSRGRSMEE